MKCCPLITIDESHVGKQLRRINTKKSPGPDGISGKLLRECCDQLAPVFHFLYQTSLNMMYIPKIWRTSLIVPVPKKQLPKEMNDLRPVALTSIAMKTFERLILKELTSSTPSDENQFAHKQNRSVNDATLTLLHNLYEHTDALNNFARVLFVDFSSAFNTIQVHVLMRKLESMTVNSNLILWIKEFLTNRVQYVKFKFIPLSLFVDMIILQV